MNDGKPFWNGGLRFACTSCGHCCRHEPGYVFLSAKDLGRLARRFSLGEGAFAEAYCRSVDLGLSRRLSLVETPENDCIFWNGGCTVYEDRPLQCRTYPFWPGILASRREWDEETASCPGMNQGPLVPPETIARALSDREREVLISPGR